MDPFNTDLVDIDYPRAVLLVLLVVINFTVISAIATSGTAYGPYNSGWDGTSELRTIADDESDMTVVHEAERYETASADGVAIIVAPQESYGPTDRAQVAQFVQRGGTLIVASEDDRTNQFLSEIGVNARIDGALVRDEQNNYRNASLPVATEVSEHRYTEAVEGVTLNYGSAINTSVVPAQRGTEWQGQYLVNSSQFAYLDRNRNERLDDDEVLEARPVVTEESVGAGTVVVVSDASVFTNAMGERDGNRRLIENIVTDHDRVLLDYSHGPSLPPLIYALLVLRSSPFIQFFLSLAATGGVAIWMWGTTSRRWLPARIRGRKTSSKHAGRLPKEELVEYLITEYPEWDEKRLHRVTEAIIRRREQSADND